MGKSKAQLPGNTPGTPPSSVSDGGGRPSPVRGRAFSVGSERSTVDSQWKRTDLFDAAPPIDSQPKPTADQDDERWMRRCLSLASNALLTAKPNPMVGAVIVCQGRILGEGYHIRCGEAHAEVNAFAAVRPEDEILLPQATLYVSLEPCSHQGKTPPCADLILRKRVPRVVVGCIDPFAQVQGRGIRKLRNAGVDVRVGVLEADCRELNRRFFTFHQHRRPYILLKWAQTANGFLDHLFRPLSISTPFTQMLSHKLRTETDAILVGRITEEREHPALNVRHWWGPHPRRLVLSHEQTLDHLLETLYRDGVQSLVVEGGAKTHQSFLERRLWDELRIETAPFTVPGGTKAVPIPEEACLVDRQLFDGHVIDVYRRFSSI